MSSFKEACTDLWNYHGEKWFAEGFRGGDVPGPSTEGCAIVVTTNGFVKNDGSAVMGRGCAKEAQRYLPPKEFGDRLKRTGNHVYVFPKRVYNGHVALITLPVKHNWWEPADPNLIRVSLHDLVDIARAMGYTDVVLPRPGCGNGGLSWKATVGPICRQILGFDGRFTVVHQPGDEEEEIDV